MPRAKGRGRKGRDGPPADGNGGDAAQTEAVEDLVADPDWADISEIPKDASRYSYFETPRAFFDAMVADSASWAHGVDRNCASCVATALGKVVVP